MESTVLIAAKQEYTEQLHDILNDNIILTMKDIWNSVKDSTQPLRTFQQKLCDIPEWNNQVLLKNYDSIIEREDITKEYLDKILEAVFLSNIKILSVVKLESKKQTINIKIPDTQNFIHRCLIQVARELYTDPHLIDDRETNLNSKLEIQRNYKRLLKITKESIEKTIRNMIPMKDILDKYLEAHDNDSLHSDENIQFAEETPQQPEIFPDPPSPPPRPITPVAPITPIEPIAPIVHTEPFESVEPTQQQQKVDDIFMEQPTSVPEEPIKVDISEERNFFSDDD